MAVIAPQTMAGRMQEEGFIDAATYADAVAQAPELADYGTCL